jgi:exopolysaccharide production protein ExoF
MRARWSFFSSLASALLFAVACSQAAHAADYRLGPGDHVRLKVLEWRPDRGETYEWPGLSGDYVIGPDGSLPLPMLGGLPASGKSEVEVAQVVGDSLQRAAGLAQTVQVSLQIVQYRPFYVAGAVEKPGEFPYRPGLSVLEAVSLAGGLHRSSEDEISLKRQAIEERGAERGLQAERQSLLATLARLQTEAAGADKIAFPAEALDAGPGGGASPAEVQTALFKSRQATLKTRLDGLEESKRLFGAEIDTLTAKLQSLSRQETLAKQELDNVSDLVKKGLTTGPHVLALEESLAQLQSTKLDYELSIVRSRQGIAAADRDKTDASNTRRNDVLAEIGVTQAKLAQNASARSTAAQLAEEVEANLGWRSQVGAQNAAPVFTVLREGEDHSIKVTEADELRPGDVLKVDELRPGDSLKVGDVRADGASD